jgi:hypothetical protein
MQTSLPVVAIKSVSLPAALVHQVAKIDGAPALGEDVPDGSPLSDGELVANIQANVTVDWTARENVRAQLLACW